MAQVSRDRGVGGSVLGGCERHIAEAFFGKGHVMPQGEE